MAESAARPTCAAESSVHRSRDEAKSIDEPRNRDAHAEVVAQNRFLMTVQIRKGLRDPQIRRSGNGCRIADPCPEFAQGRTGRDRRGGKLSRDQQSGPDIQVAQRHAMCETRRERRYSRTVLRPRRSIDLNLDGLLHEACSLAFERDASPIQNLLLNRRVFGDRHRQNWVLRQDR